MTDFLKPIEILQQSPETSKINPEDLFGLDNFIKKAKPKTVIITNAEGDVTFKVVEVKE